MRTKEEIEEEIAALTRLMFEYSGVDYDEEARFFMECKARVRALRWALNDKER